MPLISKPWPSSRAVHSRPNRRGEGFFQVLGDDRGDRADVLVVAQGVRGPPFAVGGWSWRRGRSGSGRAAACRRRGRCAAASAPRPGRPRATGRSPGRAPGCCASRCGCSRPRAGSSRTRRARPARSCRRPRRPGRTSTGRPAWSPAWRARRAFSPREAWKIEMDLDSERVRSKNRGLCRVCLVASIRSSRLRSAVACGSAASSAGVQVGGFAAAVGWPAQRGAVGGLALAEQQVVGFALDRLAGLEAEGFGAGAPPAAGRLAAAFAGLDVVAGRVLGRAAVDLLPDVVKVVALAQRRDDRHRLIPPPAEGRGCP